MSARTDDAVYQSSLSRPPRRGSIIALTVDATARPYKIADLPIVPASATRMFVAFQADGGDIYYQFSNATHSDLDEGAIIAAGGALAFAGTYGALLPDGAVHDLALDGAIDQYLIVKTVSGNATLRFFASSDPQ